MRRLPAFSVILSFVVLSVIGAAFVPLLNIQYDPAVRGERISVYCHWDGASPQLMESEVISVLEGLASSISGVKSTSSVSYKGSGYVTVELKRNADAELVRFELSTLIRRYADRLPEGVGYPQLSGAASGAQERAVLSYTLYGGMPSQMIARYVEERMMPVLKRISGVNRVELTGVHPFSQYLVFSPEKLERNGLTVQDVLPAVSRVLAGRSLLGSADHTGILISYGEGLEELMEQPLIPAGGRLLRLADLARTEYREKEPERYYRINGQQTVNLTCYAESDINIIRLADEFNAAMDRLAQDFPDGLSVRRVKDDSRELRKELHKIYLRTGLSLLILLAFVFLVSRSLRYLFVIASALLANVLTAVFFYVVFGVSIHLYSLAGITVSLGILIDTSIVMISHYGYYRNRNVFIAILAAQLTTIGALSVVFLLPSQIRERLTDFAAVIIINLAISLLVAMLLIPALSDTLGVRDRIRTVSRPFRRRILRFNRGYARFIVFGRAHRWAFLLLLVLAFGLPVSRLPGEIGEKRSNQRVVERTPLAEKAVQAYNATFGSDFFQQKLKGPLDYALGGTLRLFFRHSSSFRFNDGTQRPSVHIRASLPDGCTVGQVNEIVREMEAYLASFGDRIERFETTVSGGQSGMIEVIFPPELERTDFPLQVKQQIIARARELGGAAWSVSGIDENYFSNNIASGWKSHRISLTGYSLEQLYAYARNSVKTLSANPRISAPEITTTGYDNRSAYRIFLDPERMAGLGVTPQQAYALLDQKLFSRTAGYTYIDGVRTAVQAESADRESYDVWNLQYEYLTDAKGALKFNEFAEIRKESIPSAVVKTDQQYRLEVAFDFIGPAKLSSRVIRAEVDRLNETVLPVGFSASLPDYTFSGADRLRTVGLLLLVILIIFFLSAILFESLSLPWAVIGLIPPAFVGLFLSFYLLELRFDLGGVAAMVMLSGLVVNSGFYLISEYQRQLLRFRNRRDGQLQAYIRAFNLKLVPILLTVVSTVLGLIPFLMDGPEEDFWFAFAVGTMGGLLFSLLGLIVLFPLWISGKSLSLKTEF